VLKQRTESSQAWRPLTDDELRRCKWEIINCSTNRRSECEHIFSVIACRLSVTARVVTDGRICCRWSLELSRWGVQPVPRADQSLPVFIPIMHSSHSQLGTLIELLFIDGVNAPHGHVTHIPLRHSQNSRNQEKNEKNNKKTMTKI